MLSRPGAAWAPRGRVLGSRADRAPGGVSKPGGGRSGLLLLRVGQAARLDLRGRPRARLSRMTAPLRSNSPPQTPHGSPRSRASARQAARTGQSRHSALARVRSLGDSAKNRSGLALHASAVGILARSQERRPGRIGQPDESGGLLQSFTWVMRRAWGQIIWMEDAGRAAGLAG